MAKAAVVYSQSFHIQCQTRYPAAEKYMGNTDNVILAPTSLGLPDDCNQQTGKDLLPDSRQSNGLTRSQLAKE